MTQPSPSRGITRTAFHPITLLAALAGAAVVLLAARQASGRSLPWLDAALQVYMPRQQCMFFEADVVWTHALSDAAIAASYFSIPVALGYFVSRRRDLSYSGVFWLFAAFILLCGLTHVFGFVALWSPLYRLDGWVKAATAGVSVATALVLWRIMPALVALPSPAQLRAVNDQLRTLSGTLERRVDERTRELSHQAAELERTVGELHAANTRLAAANTRLEEAADQEAALRRESERLSRMKDEFLGTLGHELRTPLNALLGWGQILQSESQAGRVPDAETVAEAAETIERNVRVQAHRVDDLLDVSRILAGKMRLDLGRTTLKDAVTGAADVVRIAADARGVRLIIRDDGGLGREIVADSERLQQVVWNLLSNAVKFTPGGGSVTVSAALEESGVRLDVVDTGKGIEPEFLPKLFEAFEQADAGASRRRGGLGLGLNIVRRIAELHGGTVEAHSDGPGLGSTFNLRLPIRSIVPDATSTAASPTREVRGTPDVSAVRPLEALRVLIVEDELDSRRVLKRALVASGADVTEASGAAAALDFLETAEFDIVVSDIGMPEMDGYEFIRLVRARERTLGSRHLPALALTAYARVEDRHAALQCGFDDHVPKPVEHDELRTRIRRLVPPPHASTPTSAG